MAASRGEHRPLWAPSTERRSATHLHHFVERVRGAGGAGRHLPAIDATGVNYAALHAWSVSHPEEFWPAVWHYAAIISDDDVEGGGAPWTRVVHGGGRMAPPDATLGPAWFDGARLNLAENLLRGRGTSAAIVAWNEEGRYATLSWDALTLQVARAAAALRQAGVMPGDRVAGFLPNIPEAVVAMLATASVGAMWSSCSPDFGVQGVLDRFGQITPRVLVVADGYRYAGKEIDLRERVAAIATAIPAIERVVVVRYRDLGVDLGAIPKAVAWGEFVGGSGGGERRMENGEWAVRPDDHSPLSILQSPFQRFPFAHPLYIMYSSGTTGLPKCMVHGAGGTLLQHLKEHQLHVDLHHGDRIFYFTTCGWMMWNWLVSALASAATIVLYDGAPLVPGPREIARADKEGRVPRPDILWELAEEEQVTVFGTSAKYLALAEKEGLRPAVTHDLSFLRTVLSTGSPLAPSGFDFVYEQVKGDVCLSSISGGTDIISCFVLGNAAGPVYRGELQVPGLGMAVEVFDELGRPLRDLPGELVCTKPFPSMPVSFWNDPGGALYRAAYFEHYAGVWRHGDWAEITPAGGFVISGRSDATLNPGGVRIGTAEIYRQVEQLPEVVESIAIGQDTTVPGTGDQDVRIILFVRLRDGLTLDDSLRDRIRRQIRANASPHHVPKVILQVADIPRTISGKISESAVREVVHGRPVKNFDALANPEALRLFVGIRPAGSE